VHLRRSGRSRPSSAEGPLSGLGARLATVVVRGLSAVGVSGEESVARFEVWDATRQRGRPALLGRNPWFLSEGARPMVWG